MLLKLILLCCILFLIESSDGVSKRKGCRGTCKSPSDCHKKNPSKPLIKAGCAGDTFCCPPRRTRQRGRPKKLSTKGNKKCRAKPCCKDKGGHCIKENKTCKGTVEEKCCNGIGCKCCVPSKLKKLPSKRGNWGPKIKECKKKKKCTGFCVNTEREECLGELDTKGCKGKNCACCTLGEMGEEESDDSGTSSESGDGIESGYGIEEADYSNSNYNYNYYEEYPDYYKDYDECYGKDINGSCADLGCFICDDGQCIYPTYKCDQYPDCTDGSDEHGCPHIKPSRCPSDFKWVMESCYQIVSQPSSWAEAQTVCRALNGQLGHIYDHKLFNAYMHAFHESILAVYWLGLHRVDAGHYTWLNGTLLPKDSPLWGTIEDNDIDASVNTCVVLDVSKGHLQTINCEATTYNNRAIYSVCEYVGHDYSY